MFDYYVIAHQIIETVKRTKKKDFDSKGIKELIKRALEQAYQDGKKAAKYNAAFERL